MRTNRSLICRTSIVSTTISPAISGHSLPQQNGGQYAQTAAQAGPQLAGIVGAGGKLVGLGLTQRRQPAQRGTGSQARGFFGSGQCLGNLSAKGIRQAVWRA